MGASRGEPISGAEQLRLWVEGRSVHRQIPRVDGGECVPDFSCCRSELQAAPEVRVAYVAASMKDRSKFLGGFLGALIESKRPGTSTRIIGAFDPGETS